MYDTGTPVNPLHLLGRSGGETEWTVRMHTGPVLDLRFISHRKRFWLEGGRVVGCNVVGRDRRWGYFSVEEGASATYVDYRDERNRLSRLILDEIRVTDYAYLVVGKFHVRLLGRKLFAGYFTLRRRGDRRRARKLRGVPL